MEYLRVGYSDKALSGEQNDNTCYVVREDLNEELGLCPKCNSKNYEICFHFNTVDKELKAVELKCRDCDLYNLMKISVDI